LVVVFATLSACAARPSSNRERTAAALSPFRSLSRDGGLVSSPRDASASPRITAISPSRAASGPWRAYLFEPLRGPAARYGVEADGTYYVIIGGVRARVRPGTVSWSPDIALGGFATAARARQGWLFVGSDGALYRAPYFTAPLERIGATNARRIAHGYISAGRVAVGDSDGQLWIGGDDGLRRWEIPEGTQLLDAGFSDDQFGVAVVSPGRLYRTVNGGARWDLVDLGGRGAFEILPESDGFVVRAPDGPMRIEANGAPTPFSGIALGTDVTVTDQNTIRTAAISEGPGSRAAQLTQGAIVLQPDRVYFATGYRGPTDRFGAHVRPTSYTADELWLASAGQPPVRIDPPAAQCRYFPWRERIAAFCRDTSGGYRPMLLAGDGLAQWTTITPPASISLYGQFASSNDGRSLWTFTACDHGGRTTGQTWCRYDGARWGNVEVERRAAFVASWGDTVAYRVAQGVFEASVPGPLRVQSTGVGAEQARPPRRSDPRARIETGAFTEDGTFYARATIEDTVVLAVGAIEQELAIRALPEGAKDVAMASSTRGLAVGDRLDRVWTTEDSGRTWRPLPLPLRGDARGIAIAPEVGDSELRVRCAAFGCSVADRLAWTSEALVGEPPPIVHSAPNVTPVESPTEAAVRPRPTAREIEFGTTRCAADAPSGTEGYFFNVGAWTRAQSGTWEWGGHDARGAFRGRARGAMPPLDAPPNWNATVFAYSPRFASRSLALIERCGYLTSYGGGARPKQCDIVALAPNQPPRTWFGLRTLSAIANPNSTPRIAELVALADGTFAVRVASGPLDDGPNLASGLGASEPRVDLVARINAEGAVLEQKGFAWARGETRMRALAFDGTRVGLIVLRASSRELRFYNSAADNGRALAPAPLRVQPCGGDPDPRAPFFVTSANDHNAAVRAGAALSGQSLFRGEDSVQTTVELGASGVCIRRVTVGNGTHSSHSATYVASQLGGALVLEASNGTFRATATLPTRRSPIDCVPDVINR
jgi:hypothetical protein